MRGLSSARTSRIQKIKTDRPLRPFQAGADGPTFSNAFWCNPTFLSVLLKTMQMHHFSYIPASFSPSAASQNGQFLRFWVSMIFQFMHLQLVCTLIIEESFSNVNSLIKSLRARPLAEPRPPRLCEINHYMREHIMFIITGRVPVITFVLDRQITCCCKPCRLQRRRT